MDKYISLHELAIAKNIPLCVSIELLTKCNWRCIHCYNSNHDNNGLNYELIEKVLYELRALGTYELTLTGGEIFIRDDALRIIQKARSLFFRVVILSNASLLNEEIVKELSNIGIYEFSTSIYSLNPEIHDRVTGIRGSLTKALENIFLLKEYKIPVKIKTPIMNENIFEYRTVKEYCQKNQFIFQADPYIKAKDDGDMSPVKYRVNNDSLEKIIKETMDVGLAYRFNEEVETCRSLLFTLHISCNGDIYPCVNFPYKVGNLLDNSINDIWKNSLDLQTIKNIKNSDLLKCKVCDLRDSCFRCPGIVYIENGDFLGCSTHCKTIASYH